MRRVSNPRMLRTALAFLAGSALILACAEEPQLPTEGPLLAKGGNGGGGGGPKGGGPSVEAADPNSAPQDTTLDVMVVGSGFDDGSVVEFLLAGESTPKVVTNSSSFISSDTLIANITVTADADTALYDIEVTTARGKKGMGSELFRVRKKGKPGEDPVYDHTIHDLGEGSISAINDAGVMAGSSEGQPAVWWAIDDSMPLLLPDPVGAAGAWALDVNETATLVAGVHWNATQDTQLGVVWEIDPIARTVVATRDLPLLPGHDWLSISGVNDLGQVVGNGSYGDDSIPQDAMLWEADASGVMVPRVLPDLPDHPASWAQSINNSGQAVGRSGLSRYGVKPRAVMWFLGADGSVSGMLDLTADSDDSGDNHAIDVTEPIGGLVWVSGYSTVGGEQQTAAWQVDVNLREVVTVYRVAIGTYGNAHGRAVNSAGEVATSHDVWQPLLGIVQPLPPLDSRCSFSDARDINNTSVLVGRSELLTSYKRGPNKTRCVSHAVVWTEK